MLSSPAGISWVHAGDWCKQPAGLSGGGIGYCFEAGEVQLPVKAGTYQLTAAYNGPGESRPLHLPAECRLQQTRSAHQLCSLPVPACTL
jgi:hypothetical protein